MDQIYKANLANISLLSPLEMSAVVGAYNTYAEYNKLVRMVDDAPDIVGPEHERTKLLGHLLIALNEALKQLAPEPLNATGN